ncbi:MAG: hypothetical protein ACRDQT_11270, partial [Gaiellaceae bacterium]
FLQRSLNRVPDEDGERLLALLEQPRKPVPIEVPAAPRRRREVIRPEPTLLDAKAVPLQVVEPAEEEGARSEPRVHTEIQAKLRDIGLHEGFDVWVADRGVEWNGKLLGEGCLADLPVVAAERTRVVMRGIDVIWFRKSAGHPEVPRDRTLNECLLGSPSLQRRDDRLPDPRGIHRRRRGEDKGEVPSERLPAEPSSTADCGT